MLLPFLVAVLLWLVVINAVTAGLYYWDKRAAKRDSWRISEADLLVTSALGGWPAAIVVGRKLRHKTVKRSYRIKFAGAVIVNLVAVGAVGLIGRRMVEDRDQPRITIETTGPLEHVRINPFAE